MEEKNKEAENNSQSESHSESAYPPIYKRLFYKEKSQKEGDIQKAWNAVDVSWKEIILNLQKTEDAISVAKKNEETK